jgi:hypothetical protein
MEELWKWLQRGAWVAAIITLIKGWISMDDIRLFWGSLNPWHFIFYLSASLILINLIKIVFEYKRFKKRVEKSLNEKVGFLGKESIKNFEPLLNVLKEKIVEDVKENILETSIKQITESYNEEFEKISKDLRQKQDQWSVNIIKPKHAECRDKGDVAYYLTKSQECASSNLDSSEGRLLPVGAPC